MPNEMNRVEFIWHRHTVRAKKVKGAQEYPAKEGFTNKLKVIARPVGFPPNVDPGNRIRDYYIRKMSVIDLVPCGWKIDLVKALRKTEKGDLVGGLRPEVIFDEYVERYKEICRNYNLPAYDGVRIYTTDETMASDQIANVYTSNVLQSIVDNLSNLGRSLKDLAQYFTSEPTVNEAIRNLAKNRDVNSVVESFSRGLGDRAKLSPETVQAIGRTIESVGQVLIKGNRISLPRIWSTTEYRPGLTANIKLISPYGHPSAIRKFIIEPLCYLVILAAPKTEDGVSWGYPFTVGVRGYGMTHFNVGYIESITMRRGGGDTAFNLFYQPLQIDVSLSLVTLTDGFAVFGNKENMGNESTISHAEVDIGTKGWSSGQAPLMVTLGNIIDSLRPLEKITLRRG